jgi:Lon protease-like protein
VLEQLPIFPLNSVVFPGMTVPLHVFEDRYRALVHHLLTIPDKSLRLFGVVAIREGYEVGSHGAQSLHRVGCVVQMTSVEPYPDGRFDIEVVGRQRLRQERLDASGRYLVGEVETVPEDGRPDAVAAAEARRTRETFTQYQHRLGELRGVEVTADRLPQDPTYLSYALSAVALLTQQQRQSLLEAGSARDRLLLLRHLLREELRAMRALPSLPATDVSRTGWSPN